MKDLSKHAEWLSLIEISGPFLTVSMLDKTFPQGLESVQTPRRLKLRSAYEEWREAVDQEDRLLSELHREWVRLVLTEMLEYDQESLIHAGDWPDALPSVSSQEHVGTFKPDWIVRAGFDDSGAAAKPRMFIVVLPPDTDLESIQRGDGWPVSLQERMTLLCRAHGVRVGLLTDGERWMLVNAPIGSTSSQASWYSRLWFQELITLKAFQSLLGVRRCFGPVEDTLEFLLDESLKHQEEVTETLGEQVRRAVEVLVQCLDKADEDRNRDLLRDVKPAELYEAGLTVMMRLVFVLCAEERGLLLLGDSVYDRCYAVSTLRGQLSEEADRHGPEVLDRRHDAWARLLAVFRAVFGGIEHESLRMPALGGSLFDPDRFPFLEGRAKGTRWRDTSAAPLPIDNRTVMLLLNSLQILEQSCGALLLSYRALDVEQIGHVYEGLLEHTVARVPRVTLGLQGSQKAKNPNVALAELESTRLDSEDALVKLILEVTGRSESAIKNGLSKSSEDTFFGRVLGVCGGDAALAERIRPFTNLLRTDAWDDPIVYRENSFMVTLGADRRETGTHYTPKSLTETIVTTTLEPVVYVGPAVGKPREGWSIKPSREILDLKVCDPAMGSGAFLVQSCRYLGQKLVEAWLHEEAAGKTITVDGDALDQIGAEEPLPSQLDERLTIARRLVAERCLYGVDVNPLAVELAKLSIWLVTLAKGRPFGFLDHNLRCGDSLLGIHCLDQLTELTMTPTGKGQQRLFGQNIKRVVQDAIELRQRLRAMPIRDIRDVEAMERLVVDARQKVELPERIADAFVGDVLVLGSNAGAFDSAVASLTIQGEQAADSDRDALHAIVRRAYDALSADLPAGRSARRPFHWPLEFPEVFDKKEPGFDSIIGNPPFLGGRRIRAILGDCYLGYLTGALTVGGSANANLCAYFFLRATQLFKRYGTWGLIATSAISEGDSRRTGLNRIIDTGNKIYQAIPLMEWPGNAAVTIALVWTYGGDWAGRVRLGGMEVSSVNASLVEDVSVSWEPADLIQNKGRAFQGSNILGKGFVLEPEEAEALLRKEAKSVEIIRKFLRGEDFVDSPKQEAKKLIIDFGGMPLSKDTTPVNYSGPVAEDYRECLSRIIEKVKPERALQKRKPYRERWWQYAERCISLYTAISGLSRVIFQPSPSKHLAFCFVDSDQVFSGPHTVIAADDFCTLGVLISSVHAEWCWAFCSTMPSGSRRYNPSDFLKFPFPGSPGQVAKIAEVFDARRCEFMREHSIGVGAFMNMLHDERCADSRVLDFRSTLKELDNAIFKAYGWSDLEVEHEFRVIGKGKRLGLAPNLAKEVINRLKSLNIAYSKDRSSNETPRKGSPTFTDRVAMPSPPPNETTDLFGDSNDVEEL